MKPESQLTIAVCDDQQLLLKRVEQQLERQLSGLPHRIVTFTGSDALLQAAAGQARACARLAGLPRPPRPLQTGGERLLLGAPGGATQLFQADIVYLERRVRTTWVHTLQGEVATGEKLEALLARLDTALFCQTHKSFAVHWPMVEQYGKTLIRLSGGVQVPVSRRYAAGVRQSFLRYVAALQSAVSDRGVPLP